MHSQGKGDMVSTASAVLSEGKHTGIVQFERYVQADKGGIGFIGDAMLHRSGLSHHRSYIRLPGGSALAPFLYKYKMQVSDLSSADVRVFNLQPSIDFDSRRLTDKKIGQEDWKGAIGIGLDLPQSEMVKIVDKMIAAEANAAKAAKRDEEQVFTRTPTGGVAISKWMALHLLPANVSNKYDNWILNETFFVLADTSQVFVKVDPLYADGFGGYGDFRVGAGGRAVVQMAFRGVTEFHDIYASDMGVEGTSLRCVQMTVPVLNEAAVRARSKDLNKESQRGHIEYTLEEGSRKIKWFLNTGDALSSIGVEASEVRVAKAAKEARLQGDSNPGKGTPSGASPGNRESGGLSMADFKKYAEHVEEISKQTGIAIARSIEAQAAANAEQDTKLAELQARLAQEAADREAREELHKADIQKAMAEGAEESRAQVQALAEQVAEMRRVDVEKKAQQDAMMEQSALATMELQKMLGAAMRIKFTEFDEDAELGLGPRRIQQGRASQGAGSSGVTDSELLNYEGNGEEEKWWAFELLLGRVGIDVQTAREALRLVWDERPLPWESGKGLPTTQSINLQGGGATATPVHDTVELSCGTSDTQISHLHGTSHGGLVDGDGVGFTGRELTPLLREMVCARRRMLGDCNVAYTAIKASSADGRRLADLLRPPPEPPPKECK